MKRKGGVKSLSGKNDRNKKEFEKITGCIYIELEGSHGQSRVGSLTFQPVVWFIHACELVHAFYSNLIMRV